MIPWNKGLTGIYSDETRQKMRLAKLGKTPWNKGIDYPAPWLDEHRYKTGHKCWKKGKIGIHSEEVRKSFGNGRRGKKISEAHKEALLQSRLGKPGGMTGKKHSTEWKKKASERMKSYPKEFFAKCLRRRPMSSLEVAFNKIVTENSLPYKFVGNGEFWIERKNPDFVNTNGQKIAIELFYRRHKEKFSGGFEKWKEDRLEVFKKYGWKIIFLEPTDLRNSLQIIKRGGE
jgi:hypothetical protein